MQVPLFAIEWLSFGANDRPDGLQFLEYRIGVLIGLENRDASEMGRGGSTPSYSACQIKNVKFISVAVMVLLTFPVTGRQCGCVSITWIRSWTLSNDEIGVHKDWCGIGNRNVTANHVRLRALGVRFPPSPHGRVSI